MIDGRGSATAGHRPIGCDCENEKTSAFTKALSPFCPVGECRPLFSKEGHLGCRRFADLLPTGERNFPAPGRSIKADLQSKKTALYQSFHNDRIKAYEIQVLSCESRRSNRPRLGNSLPRTRRILSLRAAARVERSPNPGAPGNIESAIQPHRRLSDKACGPSCTVLNQEITRSATEISVFLKRLHGFLMRNLSL